MASADDARWVQGNETDRRSDEELSRRVAERYPVLERPEARLVYSSLHDVAEVVDGGDRYALKLYRPSIRSGAELGWEVDLHAHLSGRGVPVCDLVDGRDGALERLDLPAGARDVVLSRWAPGTKPRPSVETYWLLGRSAALLHAAADDGFRPGTAKVAATVDSEVHVQVARLRPALERVGCAGALDRLAEPLARFLEAHRLERGVCHSDLTLDNVHVDGDELWVFDLDSACEHWRAWEAQSVFHFAALSGGPWWEAWLDGYGEVRPFPDRERRAVPWFVLMAHFEHTAWKLGLTPTSTGVQLEDADLPALVATWTGWADQHCVGS